MKDLTKGSILTLLYFAVVSNLSAYFLLENSYHNLLLTIHTLAPFLIGYSLYRPSVTSAVLIILSITTIVVFAPVVTTYTPIFFILGLIYNCVVLKKS